MIDVLDIGYVRLINVMGSDLEVANAARVSYDKRSDVMSERDERLIDFLWREEHTSPFRHCTLSFEIYAPLMVARQHWKYAVASTFVDDQNGWNESSRRYITEEPEFYIPSTWRCAPENSKQGSGAPFDEYQGIMLSDILNNHIKSSMVFYETAIDSGIAPEMARLFLPAYGMYVRYRWTTSLHGVMHFLQQRLEHDSQYEIQEYAKAIRDALEKTGNMNLLRHALYETATGQSYHYNALAHGFLEKGSLVYDPKTYKYRLEDSKDNFRDMKRELYSVGKKYNLTPQEIDDVAHRAFIAERLEGLSKADKDIYIHLSPEQIAQDKALFDKYPELKKEKEMRRKNK